MAAQSASDANPAAAAPVQPHYPFFSALTHGSVTYGLKSLMSPLLWARGWHEYLYPTEFAPDYVKTYEGRPGLPVR